MAKVKTKPTQDKVPEDRFVRLPNSHDKKEKEGGKVIVTESDYFVRGLVAPLLAGTVLKECNDGLYAIYKNGERIFIRVTENFVKTMKESIKTT